jgi:hypothetical protein
VIDVAPNANGTASTNDETIAATAINGVLGRRRNCLLIDLENMFSFLLG